MGVNLSRISEKVSDIKQSLELLRAYAARTDMEFLSNDEAIRSARYSFIVLIEAMANVASHLCVKLLSRAPTSYADGFLLLAEAKMIPTDLADRLGRMAAFRNLLVHGYGQVDNTRMMSLMRNELGDVDEFLDHLHQLLRRHTGGDTRGR